MAGPLLCSVTPFGTVYYLPGAALPHHDRLPVPSCRPRQRRPHRINITRLSADHGLQPVPRSATRPPGAACDRRSSRTSYFVKLASRENAKRLLGTVWAPLSGSGPSPPPVDEQEETPVVRTSARSAAVPAVSAIAPMDGPTLNARRAAMAAAAGNLSRSMPPELATKAYRRTIQAEIPKEIAPVIPDISRPVCAGNGVSCNIILAEPVLFIKGLDHDGSTRDTSTSSGAICRGRLQINVQKSAKIKAITLKFTGKARTEWPEGIPPAKQDYFEEDSLRTQIMPFFNAMYEGSDRNYGPLCHYAIRTGKPSPISSMTNLSVIPVDSPSTPTDRGSPTTPVAFSVANAFGGRTNRSSITSEPREYKRLSLQTQHTKSYQKAESPASAGPTPQQKGYKIFHPGIYEYHFEFPIDNNSPETTKLHLASVMWMLEVLVERAGTFKPNLQGYKEIEVIRSPSEDSLELIEPISISRKWEDQLHYDIVISGKSFPLGSKIPIAFKLTPLAKVQVHKLKVYLSENIEYFTNDRRVTRKEMARKILLLEKSAGRPLSRDYADSEVKILAGGEPDTSTRMRAREMARRQREREALQNGTQPVPLPEPSENMLGDLDLGLEGFWGQTEIEMNVQLPTCEMMRKDRSRQLNHTCTWKNVNVHHWIKIVMRISRVDADDPTQKKRRHFEISIDSPLTILNCRATQSNLALPSYTDLNASVADERQVCGCPNAAFANGVGNVSPASSTDSVDQIAEPEQPNLANIAAPAQAHLNSNSRVQRPMHMIRNPSYNPPAFDAEEPPPPMPTPPPLYDHIIGTPSVDGLADYFARLGQAYDEESDEETRSNAHGRVNVANPRTPGGRLARSMDIDREFMFNANAIALRRLNGQPSGDGLGVSGAGL